MTDIDRMTAAVHAYIAAFEKGDPDAAAALYAEDCTVEDPIGAVIKGRAAVRAFYAQAMATGAKLRIDGPVRVAANYAAFAFSVNLNFDNSPKRIDVIDTLKFDDAGKIIEMLAFWGPSNMHGF